MFLHLKLAWRNIFRNKRRTILASIVIGIGLASLILTDGLMIGMIQSMIRLTTSTFMGHAQIHKTGFRKTYEVENTINNLPDVIKRLESSTIIESFTKRTQSFAMISSSANSTSLFLYGIDPNTEPNISKIKLYITRGEFLSDNDNEKKKILIGIKLAKTLEVDIGDRIVVTVAQANTGELSQELYRVGGIFNFKTRQMDEGVAFISLKNAQKLLNIKNEVHEIAIRLNKFDNVITKTPLIFEELSKNENEALTWNKLVPAMEAILEMSNYSTIMIGAILFIIIVFAIMNTMFMSIYERMFEFGVIKAIGTRPISVGFLILTEAGALAILSIITGFIITVPFSIYLTSHGVDYGGAEYVGVAWVEPIKTVFNIRQVTLIPFVIFLLTIIAAIYPALFASKILPAKAMRKSM